MTIALGILCGDGVVLGVDTQHTLGDGQFPEKKLFTFPTRGNHRVVAAGFGNSDSIRIGAEEIDLALDGSASTVRGVRSQIGTALGSVYSKHIDVCPEEERGNMEFSFLVAIHIGRRAGLFRTNRTMVVEVPDRWTMGVGEQFARYAISAFLGDHPRTDVAAQVAAFVIGLTKESIDGVGFSTDVHVLENSGSHWSLHLPEVKEIENNFASLLREFKSVISATDCGTTEGKVREGLLRMEAAVLAIRTAQSKRQTLRASRNDATVSAPPDPQLTKGDPSVPPASPGSPEGSGVS